MTIAIYKPVANEVSVNSTATTLGGLQLFRVLNISTANAVLIFANTGGQYGNLTINSGQEVVVWKNYSDTLAANTAANSFAIVPIANRN